MSFNEEEQNIAYRLLQEPQDNALSQSLKLDGKDNQLELKSKEEHLKPIDEDLIFMQQHVHNLIEEQGSLQDMSNIAKDSLQFQNSFIQYKKYQQQQKKSMLIQKKSILINKNLKQLNESNQISNLSLDKQKKSFKQSIIDFQDDQDPQHGIPKMQKLNIQQRFTAIVIIILIIIFERIFHEQIYSLENQLIIFLQAQRIFGINNERQTLGFWYSLYNILQSNQYIQLLFLHIYIIMYYFFEPFFAVRVIYPHICGCFLCVILLMLYQSPRPYWMDSQIISYSCQQSYSSPSYLFFVICFGIIYIIRCNHIRIEENKFQKQYQEVLQKHKLNELQQQYEKQNIIKLNDPFQLNQEGADNIQKMQQDFKGQTLFSPQYEQKNQRKEIQSFKSERTMSDDSSYLDKFQPYYKTIEKHSCLQWILEILGYILIIVLIFFHFIQGNCFLLEILIGVCYVLIYFYAIIFMHTSVDQLIRNLTIEKIKAKKYVLYLAFITILIEIIVVFLAFFSNFSENPQWIINFVIYSFIVQTQLFISQIVILSPLKLTIQVMVKFQHQFAKGLIPTLQLNTQIFALNGACFGVSHQQREISNKFWLIRTLLVNSFVVPSWFLVIYQETLLNKNAASFEINLFLIQSAHVFCLYFIIFGMPTYYILKKLKLVELINSKKSVAISQISNKNNILLF